MKRDALTAPKFFEPKTLTLYNLSPKMFRDRSVPPAYFTRENIKEEY